MDVFVLLRRVTNDLILTPADLRGPVRSFGTGDSLNDIRTSHGAARALTLTPGYAARRTCIPSHRCPTVDATPARRTHVVQPHVATHVSTCPGCGAHWPDESDDCAARFNALLALDHSHAEPWGSRHGSAFAVFALQHPDRHSRESLERAWILLQTTRVHGLPEAHVIRRLRRSGKERVDWGLPSLPAGRPRTFDMTIADRGDFQAGTYAAHLEPWCAAPLRAWPALATA